MKHFYLQFFTGDWMKDPRLSVCTPASRGIWIDLICAMHEFDRSGELRGTSEQLARLARCSTVELETALTDLQANEAAKVENRNGTWLVVNRRMKKEADTRKKRALAGSKGGSTTQANLLANDEAGCEQISNSNSNYNYNSNSDCTDEQWLESLLHSEAYRDIEVKKEYAKMGHWCTVKGVKPTRRRFLNWLNRVEKPVHPHLSEGREMWAKLQTKYGLPLPNGCSIRKYDNAVLDSSGRVMDINQVRKALKA